MDTLYTPEFLASLSDEDLTGHLKDTISDCGEQDRDARLLSAEFDRRGLSLGEPVDLRQDGHFATSVEDFAMLVETLEGHGARR